MSRFFDAITNTDITNTNEREAKQNKGYSEL
jgi:hypothetical protein